MADTAKEKLKLVSAISDKLYPRLKSCDICPRDCHVDRLAGQTGYCGANADLRVYTAFLHQGEEPGISEGAGSGAIFFSGCSLKCCYCQNWRFSHQPQGTIVTGEQLSAIMLKLQEKRAANINLVTPTHFLPQILKSLALAFDRGLNLPIVYNTSGYEKSEIIEKLGGIVDVYLADLRYFDPDSAQKYSAAKNYPAINQAAIKAMYSQKKDQGLIIRHLALPGHLEETRKILNWLKKNTPQAKISVMFQYQPYYQAEKFTEINRRLTADECHTVATMVDDLGLDGWVQEFNPDETLAGVHFQPTLDELLK